MATCVGYQTPSIDKPAERIQEVAIFLVHKTAQCEPNDLCVKACPGCMLSGSEEGVNIFRSGDDFAKALADPLCTLQTPDWQVREYFNQEFSRHRVDGTWEVSRVCTKCLAEICGLRGIDLHVAVSADPCCSTQVVRVSSQFSRGASLESGLEEPVGGLKS